MKKESRFTIRHHLQPGDVGYLIYLELDADSSDEHDK
jgi:hypothetical protein